MIQIFDALDLLNNPGPCPSCGQALVFCNATETSRCIGCNMHFSLSDTPETKEALHVVRKHVKQCIDSRKTLQQALNRDISMFLEQNPYGSVEEFYNFIITTK